MTGVVRTPEERRAQLAEAIVSVRGHLGITQEEFAARAGLSLKTVQRIELGRVTPTVKTFNALDLGANWSPDSARRLYDTGVHPAAEDVRQVAGNGAARTSARQRLRSLTDVQLAERIVEIAEVQGLEAAGEYLAKVREIRQEDDQAASQGSESSGAPH